MTAPLLTVPLMLALVFVGGFAMQSRTHIKDLQHDLTAARDNATQLKSTLATIDSLVTDTNSRVYYLPSQGTATQLAYGKVYTKPEASDAVLMVWGLQGANNSSEFQVMLERRNGTMVPSGVFHVDHQGNAAVLLNFDQPFTAYESVRVVALPTSTTTLDGTMHTELLSAQINPVVGLSGDVNPPPTK